MKMMKLDARNLLKVKSKEIPVFFACDDKYVKYMMVTMRSLIAHTSPEYKYKLHVLHTDISHTKQELVLDMEKENVSISFHDVSGELKRIEKKLSLRDYYSNTTYYRVFIADLFPQYNKVLYIDSDTILLKDVAELYQYRLGENYIGAVQDNLVKHEEVFGDYAEKVLGISRAAYFNAGVVLLNCKQFRKQNIQKQFVELLNTYSFVVAQDQDYLNILCQDHVLWIDSRWNVQMSEKEVRPREQLRLIHYNLAEKPWNHKDGRYAEYFWIYAKNTPYYEELCQGLASFNEEDRKKDEQSGRNLLNLAIREIHNEDNYFNRFVEEYKQSLTRQQVIEKIQKYEKEGRFDEDVEDDPPSRMLMPNEVDYLRTNINNRLRTKYAFKIARWFLNNMIRRKQIIIKEIRGIENYRTLNSGAIITCNHFNAFDSFAMHIAYEKARPKRRKLFRVIKEGNYTSFPGFYGFLMRNCNTLPLSSNKDTMKKFIRAVDKILQKGHFILIYPEQSMWWNYRKPKPLKKGGYTFAAKNNVPVLPCFITMEDSNVPGEGGFPVQAYTIHIAPPIYPDKRKSKNENMKDMMKKNAQAWKRIYEEAYGIPLSYTCADSYVQEYLEE